MNEITRNLYNQCVVPLSDGQQGFDFDKFKTLIVTRITDQITREINVALEYDEPYALATLQALNLNILTDFDIQHEDI